MIALLAAGAGCQSQGGATQPAKPTLIEESYTARAEMRKADPTLEKFFDSTAGYVVFPRIGKGGLVFGAAWGQGIVFESMGKNNAAPVGQATITQGSFGLQIGGQTFSEIIFFRDDAALSEFKRGNFELSAGASAVGVKAGMGGQTDYNKGVAVFIKPQAGFMAEATFAGQSFKYEPLPEGNNRKKTE